MDGVDIAINPEAIEESYRLFPARVGIRECYREALLAAFDTDDPVPHVTVQQM